MGLIQILKGYQISEVHKYYCIIHQVQIILKELFLS